MYKIPFLKETNEDEHTIKNPIITGGIVYGSRCKKQGNRRDRSHKI